VQAALLPFGLPKRLKGVDVAARFLPARELGGDLYDFLSPEPHSLVVAVGDVSGKGVPAALYGAFAGELVRSRTFRRRYVPDSATPAAVLSSVNTILHERQLEEYYCTLCYAFFDLKRRTVVLANSGLPYPIRCTGEDCAPFEVAGVPLGSFGGISYDEVSFDLRAGDLFVSAPTASSRRSVPRAASSAFRGCWPPSGRSTRRRRAPSSTRSSMPCTGSGVTLPERRPDRGRGQIT
jgi:sigma-B regulation protein RsbU (phosphoserine phosphatase)